MVDKVFIGTEMKYAVNITAAGFSIADDDFEIDVARGSTKLHFDKADLPFDDKGQYYLCFDTAELGTGDVSVVITAHVPDSDFADGIRDEVVSFILLNVERTPKK